MMMVKIVAKKLTVLVQEVRIVSNDCEDSAINYNLQDTENEN